LLRLKTIKRRAEQRCFHITGGNSQNDDVPLQEAIALVKELGIAYKEGKENLSH